VPVPVFALCDSMSAAVPLAPGQVVHLELPPEAFMVLA